MGKTICFDLRALQIGHEHRGIGMVARSLLENINDDENKYIFYIFDNNNPIKELGIKLNIKKYKTVKTPKLKTVVRKPSDMIDAYRLSHHTFKELSNEKPDVFLQFDPALGVPGWRKTKTFCYGYDLIPLVMRNEYLPSPALAYNQAIGKKSKIKSFIRAFYYNRKYHRSYSVYNKVNKIISISDATKKSFIDLLDIKEDKIETIHLAPVASTNRPSDKIAKKIDLPYLLYVGGTDSRKRVEEVVYSFNIARARGENLALVLAGNEFKEVKNIPNVVLRNAIEVSPYKSDIHLVGFVSDSEKLGLYKDAYAFIFCTMYEGFGLPVIEAQQAGCPVISYDNSSIREVAEETAHLVATGDYTEVAKKIIELENKEVRDKYIELGKKRSATFTWQKTSKRLLDVITAD